MIRWVIVLIIFSFVLIGAGCANQSKIKEPHVPPHTHHYPFTEVLGDYHVRLVVNHTGGEMVLIFEDISEKPIKLLRLKTIKGKVILPDGRVIEETFRTEKHPGSKYRTRRGRFRKRLVGLFLAQAEWVKTTPKFDLKVTFPFRGKDSELTFNYEVAGGEIPFHRK